MKMRLVRVFLEAHHLFLFIALTFGIIFSFITPPLWGYDEPSHFARSYQISKGQLLPIRDTPNFGGTIPVNLQTLEGYRNRDMLDPSQTNSIFETRVTDSWEYERLTNEQLALEEVNYPLTASYSPVAYIGPTVGILLSKSINANLDIAILLARLFSLFTYVLLVFIGLYLIKGSNFKWAVFITALIPMTIFQAAVITADNITIGLSLLFASLLVYLWTKPRESKDTYYFAALTASGFLLALAKANYSVLGLAVFLVPNNIFKDKKRAYLAKTICFVLIMAAAYLWSTTVDPSSAPPISQRPDGLAVDPSLQIALVKNQPLDFILAIARSLYTMGDSYLTSLFAIESKFSTLVTTVLLSTLLISTLMFKDELGISKINRAFLAIPIVIGTGIIFLALYMGFTPVGSKLVGGIQGRYFIPYLLPALIFISSILPGTIALQKTKQSLFFGITATTMLLLSTTIYYLNTY